MGKFYAKSYESTIVSSPSAEELREGSSDLENSELVRINDLSIHPNDVTLDTVVCGASRKSKD